MIDYEKLKEEIDLIHKRIYAQKDEQLNEDAKRHYESVCYSLESIYSHLYALQELTQPQPKYKVGQIVYLMGDDRNPIDSFKIDEIIWDEGNYWYLVYTSEGDYSDGGKDFNQFREDCLYHSRESFIESQIEYWQSLIEPSESKLCPECGTKRVADGMCWNGGCRYIEPDKSVTDCNQLECDQPIRLCNFPDFKGNEIHEGDTLVHPESNESFLVKYDDTKMNPWRAVYKDGQSLSLGRQVGYKGQAYKSMEPAECEHDEYIAVSGKPMCRKCGEVLYQECTHVYHYGFDTATTPTSTDIRCLKCGEAKECDHEPSDEMYLSNPGVYKCHKCGEYYR